MKADRLLGITMTLVTVCLFFCAALPSHIAADDALATQHAGLTALPLNTHLGHLTRYRLESGRRLSIEELVSAPASEFKRATRAIPNLGFTEVPYWFVIDTSQMTALDKQDDLVLAINFPAFSEIDTYFVNGDQVIQQYHQGTSRPYSERIIDSYNFILPLPDAEFDRIYVRAHSISTMIFPAKILQRSDFYADDRLQTILWGLYYGIFIAMILYNAILLFLVREKAYAFYVLYLMSLVFAVSIINGFSSLIFEVVPKGFINYGSIVFTCMLNFTSIQFARYFMSTYTHVPKLDNALIALSILPVIILSMIFLSDFSASQLTEISTINAILYALLLFITGVVCMFKGERTAIYFVLAWSALLTGIITYALLLLGIIEMNIITLRMKEVGAAAEAVLLSLGLADKINKERKGKMQAQLEAESKSQFLATMSHEIRTPINGVLGLAELLKDTSLDAKQKHYVNTIVSSGNSLLHVVNDILDFSKIDAGKMKIETIDYDLFQLIEECADIFTLTCQQKGLDLKVDFDSETPQHLLGDPTRIKQILTNFIGNACKFTEYGSITLRARVVKEKLILDVSDTGIGLASHQKHRLFDSFSQADTSTSRRFGGSGLGLAICKRLAEMMEAKVSVESEPDNGSTFTLTLPIHRPEKHDESKQSPNTTLRAMVISSGFNNLYLSRYLRAQGVHVEHLIIQHQDDLATAPLQNARQFDFTIIEYKQSTDHLSSAIADRLTERQQPFVLVCHYLDDTPNATVQSNAAYVLAAPVTPLKVQKLLEQLKLQHSKPAELKPRVEDYDFSALRVLVAEDNKTNQLVIRGMLKRAKVQQLDLADDGVAAVEMATRGRYDIILMDCEMPVLDGYEATRQIREMDKTSETPIVALSAHALPEYQSKALNAGMDHFVTKPFNYETLCKALSNYGRPHRSIEKEETDTSVC